MRLLQDFRYESLTFIAFFTTLPLYSPNLVVFGGDTTLVNMDAFAPTMLVATLVVACLYVLLPESRWPEGVAPLGSSGGNGLLPCRHTAVLLAHGVLLVHASRNACSHSCGCGSGASLRCLGRGAHAHGPAAGNILALSCALPRRRSSRC